MLKRLSLVLFLGCVLALSGALHAQNTPFNVLATTTIIADVAQNVGGDLITIKALIPPDTDIHAFQPTPADVVAAAQADLVLVNGVGLEAFLGDLLQGAVADESRIVVVSNGIHVLAGGEDHDHDAEAAGTAEADATAEAAHAAEYVGVLGDDAVCGGLMAVSTEEAHEGEDGHEHGPCDPHVWTDPTNVKIWADNIAEAFATLDPANAETYRANAEAYKTQLDTVDAEIMTTLSVLPAERRVLVTNHDFLHYFAVHYDLDIVGAVIPSLSTLVEPAPQDLASLIETIKTEQVPAIFVEVSDPALLAQVVADEVGSNVAIVTLYSDSLSTPDSAAGTYIDYLRANAHAIVEALQ